MINNKQKIKKDIVINDFINFYKQELKDNTKNSIEEYNYIIEGKYSNKDPKKASRILKGILEVRFAEEVDLNNLYINGKGYRYLRKLYAVNITKGNNDKVIPLNKTGFDEPYVDRIKYGPYKGETGYKYHTDDGTVHEIYAFRIAIQKTNAKYKKYDFEESVIKLNNDTYGIIGINIPYNESSWVTKLKKGKAKNNPAITDNGIYYFGEAAITWTHLSRAIRYLKIKDKTIWGSISRRLMNDNVIHNCTGKFNDFMMDQNEFIANAGIDGHAIVFVKDIKKHKLLLIDPWRPSDYYKNSSYHEKFIKNMKNKYNYTVEYVEKEPDQEHEGSCVIVSFARALWIAKEGISKANKHPIPFDYGVLALRLLRPRHKVKQIDIEDLESEQIEKQKKKEKQPFKIVIQGELNSEDKSIDKGDKSHSSLVKIGNQPRGFKGLEYPSGEHEFIKKRQMEARSEEARFNPYENERPCMIYNNNPSFELQMHQKRIIQFMLDTNIRGIVLFHSLGSGKTITAIAIARCLMYNNLKIKMVVATPPSVVKQFEKEILNLKAPDINDRYKVVSHPYLAKHYLNLVDKNTILIIDEAHNLKNPTSKRAMAIMEAAKDAYKVLLLTATPAVNDTGEIANLIAMINGTTKVKRLRNELLAKHIDPSLFRCKFSYYKVPMDIKKYPIVSEKYKTFRMSEEYYKKYLELQSWSNPQMNDKGKLKNPTLFYNGIRKAIIDVDDELGLTGFDEKQKWTIEKIRTEVPQGKKFVIYSGFRATGVDKIENELKKYNIPVETINGSVSAKKRLEIKERYNRGEIKVLIITIAGAEGLDLKNTTALIILDPVWNNTKLDQIVGRVARYESHIGLPKEDRHVDIYYLILKKPKKLKEGDDVFMSADEIIYRMSQQKNENIVHLYDMIRNNSAEKCNYVIN